MQSGLVIILTHISSHRSTGRQSAWLCFALGQPLGAPVKRGLQPSTTLRSKFKRQLLSSTAVQSTSSDICPARHYLGSDFVALLNTGTGTDRLRNLTGNLFIGLFIGQTTSFIHEQQPKGRCGVMLVFKRGDVCWRQSVRSSWVCGSPNINGQTTTVHAVQDAFPEKRWRHSMS